MPALQKYGVPDELVQLILSFHGGIKAEFCLGGC